MHTLCKKHMHKIELFLQKTTCHYNAKTIRHPQNKWDSSLSSLIGSLVWLHTEHMGYEDSETLTKSAVAAQRTHMSSNPAEKKILQLHPHIGEDVIEVLWTPISLLISVTRYILVFTLKLVAS